MAAKEVTAGASGPYDKLFLNDQQLRSAVGTHYGIAPEGVFFGQGAMGGYREFVSGIEAYSTRKRKVLGMPTDWWRLKKIFSRFDTITPEHKNPLETNTEAFARALKKEKPEAAVLSVPRNGLPSRPDLEKIVDSLHPKTTLFIDTVLAALSQGQAVDLRSTLTKLMKKSGKRIVVIDSQSKKFSKASRSRIGWGYTMHQDTIRRTQETYVYLPDDQTTKITLRNLGKPYSTSPKVLRQIGSSHQILQRLGKESGLFDYHAVPRNLQRGVVSKDRSGYHIIRVKDHEGALEAFNEAVRRSGIGIRRGKDLNPRLAPHYVRFAMDNPQGIRLFEQHLWTVLEERDHLGR